MPKFTGPCKCKYYNKSNNNNNKQHEIYIIYYIIYTFFLGAPCTLHLLLLISTPRYCYHFGVAAWLREHMLPEDLTTEANRSVGTTKRRAEQKMPKKKMVGFSTPKIINSINSLEFGKKWSWKNPEIPIQ